MSRSISEPIEPEDLKPEISNAEVFDLGMGTFFSLEEIHNKLDLIMQHLGIEMPKNKGESPEN
jgi:hypothetical protein